MSRSKLAILNQTFGKLTVIAGPFSGTQSGRRITVWKTQCTCKPDTFFYAIGTCLVQGKVKSCGCLRREMALVKLRKGGRRKKEVST